MVAQEIKLNCAECMKGFHEKCTHENCLCREDKHGENLRNGAKVNPSKKVTLRNLMEIFIVENDLEFDDKDRIDNVTKVLRKFYHFITLRKTEKLLLYNGMIYDSINAETLIKEETEILIPNCPEHDRIEVIKKIKCQTYRELDAFDKDPNLITVLNGILNLETLELTPHTPKHLSQVLLPVEFNKPVSNDIVENLKDTLFWKYLTASFTINGKFKTKEFETVLEITASPIIKRHIVEKAFMFL